MCKIVLSLLLLAVSPWALADTTSQAPTSDDSANVFSGTGWSGTEGTRYTLVDDHPDSGGTDILSLGLAGAGGNIAFGFTAFSVASATINSVCVDYYDSKTGSNFANLGGRLKVNDSYFNATTHDPANGTLTVRQDCWATNPDTAAAWTLADVNGTGANPLQAFGVASTDASPVVNISSIQVTVDYTPSGGGSSNLPAISRHLRQMKQ